MATLIVPVATPTQFKLQLKVIDECKNIVPSSTKTLAIRGPHL